ncbi:cyclin-D2-2-like [Panicum virgatum]|uniref:cyclin-D2-2-like n=1 Tax=Panicum virgatum TaxID=38727 RepID=UPI0019D5F71C|nr:cyclin-D2-2-like [Panicum virgatum]
MGFLSAGGASPSSSLLCEETSLLCKETMDDVFGCIDGEGELPELGAAGLDFLAFPLESEEVVASLMEKEKEQLVHVTAGNYLQRLNSGGVVSSWRIASIDWINKPEKPWVQQLLSVGCLSIAAKMEETLVPRCLDFQFCSEKYKFGTESIKNMEIFVMSSLNWRMQAVTPFSYINYFMDKFTQGKPLSCGFASRCTELILGTLEATKFLQFRPSEIAAAAVLSAATESHAVDFSSALIASNIPVNKQTVRRCYEAMQEVRLVKKSEEGNASPSVPKSPYGVLDASCFNFKADDSQTPGSSQTDSDNNNHVYTAANKRTKLDA